MLGLSSQPFAYIQEKVNGLMMLAQPLVQAPSGMGSRVYWGINPAVYTGRLTGQEQIQIFPAGNNATAVLAHDGFSKNTLTCYKSVYGLMISDFPKFAPGSQSEAGGNKAAGAYFVAYRDRIRDVVAGVSATPHQDKRWHVHAYMPDINEDIERLDKEMIKKAFLEGLVLGLLKVVDEDGNKIWLCKAGDFNAIKVNGSTVKGHYHRLYHALEFNPAVVERVMKAAAQIRQIDQERWPDPQQIGQHRFFKGCQESLIFDGIFAMPAENPAATNLVDLSINSLMPGFFAMVDDYFKSLDGRNGNLAHQAACSFLEELSKGAEKFNSPSQRGSVGHEAWSAALANF